MMERQDKTLGTTTNLSNPILYVPKIMFLTKGKGLHKDYLTSFELALRDAEIAISEFGFCIKYKTIAM